MKIENMQKIKLIDVAEGECFFANIVLSDLQDTCSTVYIKTDIESAESYRCVNLKTGMNVWLNKDVAVYLVKAKVVIE